MATERSPISFADFEAGLAELDGKTEFLNVMIYGDSAVGKTHLAGTLPGRILILAGEPGYVSAANAGAKGQVRLIPDPATASAAISWLEAGNVSRYDWVVVEGLSTLQNKFLLAYCAEAFDANPAKRTHRNLPDKPDYFNAQNMMKSLTSRFVDLPVNVLFTTHAMRPENDEGELLVLPAIQGKGYEVSNFVSGQMYLVGYMAPRLIRKQGEEPKQVRRILWQTIKDAKTDTIYYAKDQSNRLGRYTDDLSMPEILQMVRGESEPATIRPSRRRAGK